MSRPRKKIDEERLRALAMIGASHELIAAELGVSHDTLTRRYLPLINESRGKGKIKVLGKAYQMAVGGNVRLLELFLVNWLGFSLRPETIVNVTQNAGQPPPLNHEQMRERIIAASQFVDKYLAETREQPTGNRFDGNGG